MSLVSAFDIPIRQSFVIQMVDRREDLPNAIALNSTLFNAARLVGPSLAVDPDGEVLLESVDPVSVVTVERDEVERARAEYPGYLPLRAKLYARAWKAVTESS